MNDVDPSKPQHMLDLYHELDASKAKLRAISQADAPGIQQRAISQIDRMISEVFFPLESIVYGHNDELGVDQHGNEFTTPAGYAWRVIDAEGDKRVLCCDESGARISPSIETVIRDFALVPSFLPAVYAADVKCSPADLDDKYGQDSKGFHPFLTTYQWRQAVRNEQTQYGYWEWVSQQLHGLHMSQQG